jgi:hypothetical protein
MPEATKAADAEQLGGQLITGQLGRYRIVEGGGWLGGGASANVFLAVNEYTMDRVAIKAIDRFVIEQNGRKRELLVRELNIATKLKHPNIINLMEVVFDEGYVHLIMELATGGELYQSVRGLSCLSTYAWPRLLTSSRTAAQVKDGAFPEPRAQVVFHQIVSALAYCHGNGVCHRDLKLENLVLVEEAAGLGSHEFVKVTDFGLSKDSAMHSQPNTKVGTISYMAPEVTMANSGHISYDGQAADVWSLGVILYILVCCAYPFGYDGPAEMGGEPTKQVCSRIRKAEFKTPSSLSKECRSLLNCMLDRNPATRISAQDALSHPWLANVKGAAHKLSSAASAAAAAGFDAVAWPVPKGAAGGTLWFTPDKPDGDSGGGGASGSGLGGGDRGTGGSLSSCASASWESEFDEINDCVDSDEPAGLASRDSGGSNAALSAAEPSNDEYHDVDELEEGEPPEPPPPAAASAVEEVPDPAALLLEEGRPGRRARRNSLQHDEDGLAALREALAASELAAAPSPSADLGWEAEEPTARGAGAGAGVTFSASPVQSLEMLPPPKPKPGSSSSAGTSVALESTPVSPAADPTGISGGEVLAIDM